MFLIHLRKRTSDGNFEDSLSEKVYKTYSDALKEVRLRCLNQTKEYIEKDQDVICNMTPTDESDAVIKYASSREVEQDFQIMELVRKTYNPKYLS